MTLPPGQHLIDGFPRFGGHLSRPAPAVPVDPRHRDPRGGHRSVRRATHHAGDASPERAHCRLSLRGWLVRHEPSLGGGLVATVYRTLIEPALPPETSVTHVVFRGLDGWRSIVSIGDAMADDVLIAERLDGRPLDSDHGAPARLVSPKQYGYVSTKHLCRIEVHTGSQRAPTGPCSAAHPKARLWEEERHRYLPPMVGATRLPSHHRRRRASQRPGRPDGSQPAAATVTGS